MCLQPKFNYIWFSNRTAVQPFKFVIINVKLISEYDLEGLVYEKYFLTLQLLKICILYKRGVYMLNPYIPTLRAHTYINLGFIFKY